MSRKVSDVFVVMKGQVTDSITCFVRAVNDCVCCMSVSDEVHAIFLTVQGSLWFALLAVTEHDGVVIAARDDRLAVEAEVEAVNLVRVLAEHLGNMEVPQHAVAQLHGGECWRWRRLKWIFIF